MAEGVWGLRQWPGVAALELVGEDVQLVDSTRECHVRLVHAVGDALLEIFAIWRCESRIPQSRVARHRRKRRNELSA